MPDAKQPELRSPVDCARAENSTYESSMPLASIVAAKVARTAFGPRRDPGSESWGESVRGMENLYYLVHVDEYGI